MRSSCRGGEGCFVVVLVVVVVVVVVVLVYFEYIFASMCAHLPVFILKSLPQGVISCL